ncbi:MAG: GFA family protein [Burkholderiales bacterium]
MIHGSCLCGSVRYEIRGPLGPVTHCHCSQCRKTHGAAFGTYVRVDRADFTLTSGESDIQSYPSSPGVLRTFCRQCGSTLQFLRESRPDSFSIAIGTLDDDPGVRPSHHIFVGSKAPWFDITDGLPQHEERKPA